VSTGFGFGGSTRMTEERTVNSMREMLGCSAWQQARSFSA